MARRKSNAGVSRETIVQSAVVVIANGKLTDWTVDDVAANAKCAKGLVLYHFKSKEGLLLEVADRIRRSLSQRRLEAVSGGSKGAPALDRLWTVLTEDLKSGVFGLWVGLLGDSRTRKAAARTVQDDSELIKAAAEALGVHTDSLGLPLIPPALDGYALELLQGRSPGEVRERFDSFWLGVLSDAES